MAKPKGSTKKANPHKGDTKRQVVFAARSASGGATASSGKNATSALLTRVYQSVMKRVGLQPAKASEKQTKSNGGNSTQTKSNQKNYRTGTKSGGSMKVDDGKDTNGKQKYISILVPSGATVQDMITFATKFKTKPTFILTPSGQRYDIDANIKTT